MAKSARELALQALFHYRKSGTWPEEVLNSAADEVDPRDGALAARICYGVLQNRALLDFYIAACCDRKLAKLEAAVLDILRLSAYQILFLTRIPPRAAVDEGVKLTRKYANPRAAGFVNAVLRRLCSKKEEICVPEGDSPGALSLRYSHPQWLVEMWIDRLGPARTEQLLKAVNQPIPLYVQTNPLRVTDADLEQELVSSGAYVERHAWMPGCFRVEGVGNPENLPAFAQGRMTIQDPAAKAAVLVLGPQPGDHVLDVCAAPGGKAFTSAMEMQNQGLVQACDIQEKKLKRIQAGADRLGITCIETLAADGRLYIPAFEERFKRVLVDAPCSGLGIIRKKPEARYKDPASLEGLPEIQLAILKNAAKYVCPGGTLVYSTCTLLQQENEGVVEAFLQAVPGFSLAGFSLPGLGDVGASGMVTLWPHVHDTDGFFICKLRRD